VGVDPELRAEGGAPGVETAAEDAVAAPVLAHASPDDHEVPARVRADGGHALDAGRIDVHLELRAEGVTGGVEAAAEDVVGAAGVLVALPDHDEVPVRIARDRGAMLEKRRVGVDLEVGAEGSPRRVEAADEDAVAAAVQHDALPYDHEAHAGQRGQSRIALVRVGEGVDGELRAEESAPRVEPAAEDAVAASILAGALPDDHLFPACIHRDL